MSRLVDLARRENDAVLDAELEKMLQDYQDRGKEIASLQQRIAELEQDARRLEAVDRLYFNQPFNRRAEFINLYLEKGGLRQAIDAAMEGEG